MPVPYSACTLYVRLSNGRCEEILLYLVAREASP